MPEKLKVLDLFSGIISGGSPLALNALAALRQWPFARLKNFPARFLPNIGPMFLAMKMLES